MDRDGWTHRARAHAVPGTHVASGGNIALAVRQRVTEPSRMGAGRSPQTTPPSALFLNKETRAVARAQPVWPCSQPPAGP